MALTLASLYSREFLINELWHSAVKSDPQNFAAFHAKCIKEVFSILNFDFLAVNRVHLNAKGLLDNELISSVYNCPESIIQNCERTLHLDTFSPVVLSHCGRPIHSVDIKSWDEWDETQFFKSHCHIYDIRGAIGVAYRFPHHKLSFLTFYYMHSSDTLCPPTFNRTLIEYASLPFYFAWLYIHERVCADTLKSYLTSLAGKTLEKIRLLREIASSPLFHVGEASTRLGVTQHTIYKHISELHEDLLNQAPDLMAGHSKGNCNRIHMLAHHYGFLYWAGPVSGRGNDDSPQGLQWH